MPVNFDRSSPALYSRRQAVGLLGAAAFAGCVGPSGAASLGADRIAALARGFNLPDWVNLDAGIAPSDAVFEALHDLGLRSVRLPVDADQFGLGDRTETAAAARRLEQALNKLEVHGFAVTVDLHTSSIIFGLFDTAPEAADAAAVAAWDALGRVVAGSSPDHVFAELLNEPPMARDRWLALRDRLAETVRRHCPAHTLIWGAARYQGIWETLETPVLADANAIAAVHYYTPLGFTHQCENWGGSAFARFRGLPFPADDRSPEVIALRAAFVAAGDAEALEALGEEFAAPWDVARIAADFADIGAWSAAQGCPVVLNEFGVLGFCVDPVSRAAWTRAVRLAAEQNGLGWAYWELDQGFGFIESRQSLAGFDLSLIDALVGDAAE